MTTMKLMRYPVAAALMLAACSLYAARSRAEPFPAALSRDGSLVEVHIHSLIFDPTNQQPVILLADPPAHRALPIWIGLYEANAIQAEMEGTRHHRPLTHDLLETIIRKTKGSITQVVITQVKEAIYYATISIESAGTLVEVDARPSDSIAMALKFKAPIFVAPSLFEQMSISLRGGGTIERRYGLTTQDLTPSLAECFSYGAAGGVLVSDVREGSRAQKDGLKRGDILVAIGGKAVDEVQSLRNTLAASAPQVEARIFRNARFLTLTIHPGQ